MSFAFWMKWLGWLAAETTALVAAAAILHLWLRSPRAGRTIWRTTLMAVALVWMVELSGLRERMARPEVRRHPFAIIAAVLPASEPEITASPKWQRRPAAEPENIGESPLPLWLWLAGSLLLLTRFGLARVWLARRQHAAAPADEDSLGIIARWRTAFGLCRVHAQIWDGLRGPVAFGVLRPTVALPSDFIARFSCAEREAMLAHEMAHLAAHDPFWWMISDAVVALSWWHPLVWWARRQLQSAHEAAADEASALIPGGAHTLAECLVRLGRELTASGPARTLGVGGNGRRSQLAARIERLLREPRAWRPLSIWARWTPQVSAMLVALASAFLPIQTGLSGSILAMLSTAAAARGEVPQSPPAPTVITNDAPIAVPPTIPVRALPLATNESASLPPGESSRAKPVQLVAALNRISRAETSTNAQPEATQIVPAARIDPNNGKTNKPPAVSLLVRFVELPEPASGAIGLDWLFGLAPNNDPPFEISHDWVFGVELTPMSLLQTNHEKTVPPALPATRPEYLVIDHLRTDGQTAILKPEQFSALLHQIGQRTDADVLATPTCVAGSGGRARLAEQTVIPVVTSVQVTNRFAGKGTEVNYKTDNVAYGIMVDVMPKLMDDGQWRLQIRASDSTFVGYDSPGKSKTSPPISGGKPMEYVEPRPHFRALEADAEATVPLGQTLAMSGPVWNETIKMKGHFLVPGKTKTVRQHLYIFVTPSLPSPSEKKGS